MPKGQAPLWKRSSYESLCEDFDEGENEIREDHHHESDDFIADLYAKSDPFDIAFSSSKTPVSNVAFVLIGDNLDVRIFSFHQQSAW